MAKLVLGLFVSIFSCLFTLSAVCLHFCWNGFYIKLGILRQNMGFAIVCSAAFSHQPHLYLRTVFENDSKSLIFIILQMNYRGKNQCHFYQFWCENWSKNLTWPEYETFFKQYDTVLHMCSPVLKSTSTCLRNIGRKFRKNRIKGWTSILKSSHSTWCFDGWKDCFEQNRIFLSQTIDRTKHFL